MKLLNIVLILALLLSYSISFSKTLWNEENNIYSSKKKYKIGDTLKIIFNEKSIVSYQMTMTEEGKKSSTTTGSSGQAIDFLPGLTGSDNFKT